MTEEYREFRTLLFYKSCENPVVYITDNEVIYLI